MRVSIPLRCRRPRLDPPSRLQPPPSLRTTSAPCWGRRCPRWSRWLLAPTSQNQKHESKCCKRPDMDQIKFRKIRGLHVNLTPPLPPTATLYTLGGSENSLRDPNEAHKTFYKAFNTFIKQQHLQSATCRLKCLCWSLFDIWEPPPPECFS